MPVYGREHCTPNMNLHCHIAECLLNYGPTHSTWCFSVECCNGILGMPNNNKSLNIVIKHFIQQMEHSMTNCQSLFCHSSLKNLVDPYLHELLSHISLLEILKLSMPVPISNIMYSNYSFISCWPMREHAINEDFVECLTEVLFHGCTIVHTTSLCQRFVRVKVGTIM